MCRIIILTLCLFGAVATLQPAAPHHSADNLPDTQFSCRDKVLGGYYADPDAQCQMFHVCVKVAGIGIQDFRFLCPNGTAFDQEAQICASWADVACEPTALYYSSDNFDLYRIGSGFESKKAPANFEDEPDFHLQRAEADIFSGAHSSNFFNNRDGKDNGENNETGGQRRNRPEDTPRKKIVKKVQRKPAEYTATSTTTTPTTAKQFSNNFAGSYAPVSRRPVTPQPQYDNNNFAGSYASTSKRPITPQPQYDNNNFAGSYAPTSKRPVTPQQQYDNSNFAGSYAPTSKRPATPQQQYDNSNFAGSYQSTSKRPITPQQQYDNSNFAGSYQSTSKRPITPQQQYDNSNFAGSYQSTSKRPTTPQPQYDNNNFAGSYGSTSKRPVTPQQQYENNNFAGSYAPTPKRPVTSRPQIDNDNYYRQRSRNQNYYNGNERSSTAITTPTTTTIAYNAGKSEAAPFERVPKSRIQTTESTPAARFYHNVQYSSGAEFAVTSPNPEIQSTEKPNYDRSSPLFDYDQQKLVNNFERSSSGNTFDPNGPSSVSTTAQYNNQYGNNNNDYNRQQSEFSRDEKSPKKYQEGASKSKYSTNLQYDNNKQSTPPYGFDEHAYRQRTIVSTTSKPEDYDDGQYKPELYEKEAGGQYDPTASRAHFGEPRESELLKTAHSINIAASGNRIGTDRRQSAPSTVAPTTTPRSVYSSTTATPRNVYSTSTSSPRNVYSTSRDFAPRPFSKSPPTPVVANSGTSAPPRKKVEAAFKPNSKSSSNPKDVSYDYAYYDNSDHYSEYENIEEFRKTSKKQ